jgi:hypothetical protein
MGCTHGLASLPHESHHSHRSTRGRFTSGTARIGSQNPNGTDGICKTGELTQTLQPADLPGLRPVFTNPGRRLCGLFSRRRAIPGRRCRDCAGVGCEVWGVGCEVRGAGCGCRLRRNRATPVRAAPGYSGMRRGPPCPAGLAVLRCRPPEGDRW